MLDIVSRRALDGLAEKYSAARLDRVELADGQQLVLKHLPCSGDWLTRATDGLGRTRQLWDRGVLADVAPVIDHAVVDVVVLDDHDVVVMRDVGNLLVPPRVPVSRSQSRSLLGGLAALHDRMAAAMPIEGLCPAEARYRMFAPQVHAHDHQFPGSHPARELILSGWNLFADQVPSDVVDAVFAVHADGAGLGERLGARPGTLLHGDAKLENLGLGPGGIVAIDWGELTGVGPAAVDVAWYAVMNAWRLGGSPQNVFDDYEAMSGRPLDGEALDLACIGSLAQMGFRFAGSAAKAPRPETRARATGLLEWWTTRVRQALERVGLA